MKIYDSRGSLVESVGDLYRVYEQDLPEEFWQELKDDTDNFKFNLDSYTKVASIPVTLFDKWLNEGFDAYSAPIEEIMKRLRMEGYDAFIVSGSKTI